LKEFQGKKCNINFFRSLKIHTFVQLYRHDSINSMFEIMKGKLSTILAVTALGVLLAGCSGVNKLIKSGNHDKMYRKALEYYNAKKYSKAQMLFQEITPFYNGTAREDSIAYYSGSIFYRTRDYESSNTIFDDFRRRFGRSPFIEDAEYMYAMSFFYTSLPPNRDQTATNQAMIAINEYLERYPKSNKQEDMRGSLVELQEKLYDKALINARSYYTTGHYKSAVIALRNAISTYPDTPHREEILYLTAKSSYLLSKNSIPSMQRDRFLDMMDAYYNFASEFPQSKYIKELNRMLAEAKDFIARNEKTEGNATQPAQ